MPSLLPRRARTRATAKRGAPPNEDEIQRRAYEIHLARGGGPGHEAEDWAQAMRELEAPPWRGRRTR